MFLQMQNWNPNGILGELHSIRFHEGKKEGRTVAEYYAKIPNRKQNMDELFGESDSVRVYEEKEEARSITEGYARAQKMYT